MSTIFLRVIMALLAVVLTSGLSAQTTPVQPDIVLFMVDDLDELTLNALLHYEAQSGLNLLPNFKQYVRNQGYTFSNSFSSNPLCCPARASYLTGQYSHNHKVLSNRPTNGTLLYFNDRSTVATWLQRAGYRTMMVGKYLNGYGSLIAAGSTSNLAILRKLWAGLSASGAAQAEPSYIPPGWTDWYAAVDPSTLCVYNFVLNENGRLRAYTKTGEVLEIASADVVASDNGDIVASAEPLSDPNYGTADNYQTDVYVKRAVELVTAAHVADPARPLFLNVMPMAPHVEECSWPQRMFAATPAADPDAPVLALQEYKELFSAKIRPAIRHLIYYDALYAASERYLMNRAPDFTVPKASFNEADLADKPPEIRNRLTLLSADDIVHQRRLFTNRMLSLIAVDEGLGHVVNRLKALGRWNKTVLIFTSDNGYANGEHRMSGKLLPYEEMTRVPMYVRLPQQVQVVSPRLVLINDLASTIAELARVAPGHEPDGRSLVPLLLDPGKTQWRKQVLIEHFMGQVPNEPAAVFDFTNAFAVRTGYLSPDPLTKYTEWFSGFQFPLGYYRTFPPLNEDGTPQNPPDAAFAWDGQIIAAELYELRSDPLEISSRLLNLNQQPVVERLRIVGLINRMRNRLRALLNCAGASCRAAEDAN